MPEIISRKEAKAKGLKRYFTGKMCCKGHTAERYVSSAECTQCSGSRIFDIEQRRDHLQRWRAEHPEYQRIYYLKTDGIGRKRHQGSQGRTNTLQTKRARERENRRKGVAALRALRELGIEV